MAGLPWPVACRHVYADGCLCDRYVNDGHIHLSVTPHVGNDAARRGAPMLADTRVGQRDDERIR